MPNAIRVRLDNFGLCNDRNIRRRQLIPPLPDLSCDELDPQLDPTTYTMDEYVLGVLKAEVGGSSSNVTSWYTEALKAMALAIRNYLWVNGEEQPSGTIIIGSTTAVQTFFPEKNLGGQTEEERYLNVTNSTSGQYMTHSEGVGTAHVISALYSTGHGPNAGTNYTVDGGKGYLKSIYDPAIGTIEGHQGHGWGMAQIGANRWAVGEDNLSNIFPPLNYQQILTHYYTDIVIRNASGQIKTPTYRWNPLTIDWGGGAFDPPPMNSDSTYNVIIALQNSGTVAWTNDFYLSYQWQGSGGTINGTTSVAIGSITEGNFTTTTLLVKTPPNPGAYTLKIDMVHENGSYFHDREVGRPWFTFNQEVCVGNACNQTYLPIVIKGSGSPGGGTCQWQVDNLLRDSGFSLSSYWQEINVFEESNPQPFSTLKALPPVSSPWDGQFTAKLGGVNDIQVGPNIEAYELFEHLVFQPAFLPNNVEQLSLEYSYYLTTFESSSGPIFDYFFVDLQLDSLGSADSLLGNPLEYNDNHPFQDVWRRRGCSIGEPNCDGTIIIENVSQFAGDTVFVVFYSEIDPSAISTFYLDAVKLSACTTN